MLEARDITVSFGGVRAVQAVSFDVQDNEIVGVVGPNGSGKTTLLNALTGVVDASGTLTVGGVAVPLGRPRRSWAAGLVRVFQNPQTFTALSCIENVLLSMRDRTGNGLVSAWLGRPLMWRREHDRWARAVAALERVGLGDLAESPAGDLTYGQQRLLELARAIAAQPRVLMLDEPSAGLNDAETTELSRLIGGLRADGMAVLVVDHKIDFIDALSERIIVLELGRVIAEGRPDAVWSDARVVDAYLGVVEDA